MNAKKLASRARVRLERADISAADARVEAGHWQIVDAFLSAARGGHIEVLVALMAPDVVRIADTALLPPGGAPTVAGDRAVAEETRYFTDRIHVSIPMLVNGEAAAVIAPGGHPLATISITLENSKITHIQIARIKTTDSVAPRSTPTRAELSDLRWSWSLVE